MKLKKISKAIVVALLVGIAAAIPVTVNAAGGPGGAPSLEAQGHYFDCQVRLFVVEPVSRWDDDQGFPFSFSVLDMPLDAAVTLVNETPYTSSFTWDGAAAGFGDITEGNIMVIAVVTTADSYTGYSDPPSGNPFDVHEVQATAAALPGETGLEDASGGTHTVFLTEATQVTCENCPLTSFALEELYAAGTHEFYYASFVEDENVVADDILHNEYNILGYPTVYTDGGVVIDLGGDSDTATYAASIATAAANAVHDLSLSVSLEWLGSAQLGIEVEVSSNELTNNAPPTPALPSGPASGSVGTPVSFVTSATDVDGDSLWYQWCVAGLCFDWYGPYASGDTSMITRTFSSAGNYGVYVKCKDNWAESLESDSATVTISDYVCGDPNADQIVNITDAVYLIQFIFNSGPSPQPLLSGDANCDGLVNITDAVYLIQFIFNGGPAPCELCP